MLVKAVKAVKAKSMDYISVGACACTRIRARASISPFQRKGAKKVQRQIKLPLR